MAVTTIMAVIFKVHLDMRSVLRVAWKGPSHSLSPLSCAIHWHIYHMSHETLRLAREQCLNQWRPDICDLQSIGGRDHGRSKRRDCAKREVHCQDMVGSNVLATETKCVARLRLQASVCARPCRRQGWPKELKVISASCRYQPKRVPLYAVVGLTLASELVLSTVACTSLPTAALASCSSTLTHACCLLCAQKLLSILLQLMPILCRRCNIPLVQQDEPSACGSQQGSQERRPGRRA